VKGGRDAAQEKLRDGVDAGQEKVLDGRLDQEFLGESRLGE
jgi:hypothetical protein